MQVYDFYATLSHWIINSMLTVMIVLIITFLFLISVVLNFDFDLQ